MKKNNRKSTRLSCNIHIASWYGYKRSNNDTGLLPPNQTFNLLIDYPLSHPTEIKIKTGKSGLGSFALVDRIVRAYNKIYEVDDNEPEDIAVSKYGIYGHSIDDLALEGIDINFVKKTIELWIGS